MILYVENEVSIWSIEDLKKSHTFDLSGCERIEDVVVTPDSKYIAISASLMGNIFDRIVKVFDTSTRKVIATYNTVVNRQLCISDDGKIWRLQKVNSLASGT
jgi:hypothetical protein